MSASEYVMDDCIRVPTVLSFNDPNNNVKHRCIVNGIFEDDKLQSLCSDLMIIPVSIFIDYQLSFEDTNMTTYFQ